MMLRVVAPKPRTQADTFTTSRMGSTLTRSPPPVQGGRQGALGDDGTIFPSSRTISVASGEADTAAARVISSSGLLGGRGGFLGAAQGFVARDTTVATESSHSEGQSSFAIDSGAQQIIPSVADVRPDTVPRHRRPRRNSVESAPAAAAL